MRDSADAVEKSAVAHTRRPSLTVGKAVLVFCITVVILLVLDRVTKIWAASALTSQGADFIPGFLGFELVYNKGASFGMMQGAQPLFIVITLVVCIAVIVYLIKYRGHVPFEVIALGCVFAGAMGNAYDRIFFGKVTDFLNFEFINFPVFNVADSAITVGIIIWIIFILFHPNSPFGSLHGSRKHAVESTDSDDDDAV